VNEIQPVLSDFGQVSNFLVLNHAAQHGSQRTTEVCAFFGVVLNFASFPFRELVIPSRTPKGHAGQAAGRWVAITKISASNVAFTCSSQVSKGEL
jgi:hypothetical protein